MRKTIFSKCSFLTQFWDFFWTWKKIILLLLLLLQYYKRLESQIKEFFSISYLRNATFQAWFVLTSCPFMTSMFFLTSSEVNLIMVKDFYYTMQIEQNHHKFEGKFIKEVLFDVIYDCPQLHFHTKSLCFVNWFNFKSSEVKKGRATFFRFVQKKSQINVSFFLPGQREYRMKVSVVSLQKFRCVLKESQPYFAVHLRMTNPFMCQGWNIWMRWFCQKDVKLKRITPIYNRATQTPVSEQSNWLNRKATFFWIKRTQFRLVLENVNKHQTFLD